MKQIQQQICTLAPHVLRAFAELLRNANFEPEILELDACTQGGNNRTYKIKTPNGLFAVKKYFSQANDTRNRLHAEFSFLTYAHPIMPHQVPRPYGQDAKQDLALYEFVEGVPMTANEMTQAEIKAAADFFCALNEVNARAHAHSLPIASEACFSIHDHLELVNGRIQQLQSIEASDDEDCAAMHLVNILNDCWCALSSQIRSNKTHAELHEPLQAQSRCISPSDFGFHNALRTKTSQICFLDFEYAGWDDPAKLIGDFFSQLAVPVPQDYFDFFVQHALRPFPFADLLAKRAELLRRLYQVKWCCIALNVFIPVNLARRRFANPNLDVATLKQTQLAKAEGVIKKLV